MTYILYGISLKNIHLIFCRVKGEAVPLEAWSGPEGSRKLRFPDFMTTAQDSGKVVRLRHRPPLHQGNAPGTHFCQRLSRPQCHSAIGRIMSLKNSNDTIGNRTRDLPVCSVVIFFRVVNNTNNTTFLQNVVFITSFITITYNAI